MNTKLKKQAYNEIRKIQTSPKERTLRIKNFQTNDWYFFC